MRNNVNSRNELTTNGIGSADRFETSGHAWRTVEGRKETRDRDQGCGLVGLETGDAEPWAWKSETGSGNLIVLQHNSCTPIAFLNRIERIGNW